MNTLLLLMNMLLLRQTAMWRILISHQYSNLKEPISWMSRAILNTTYHQPQIMQLQVQRCKILLHRVIYRKTDNSRTFLLSQASWYIPMCHPSSNCSDMLQISMQLCICKLSVAVAILLIYRYTLHLTL